MKETIKRFVKGCIPWRFRYFIKLQEAKGNIKLPESIKQYRGIEEYNNELYTAMKDLRVVDFTGKIVCEMGPGQHLSHAFMEYQLGAEKEILLEIADFAHVDNLVNLANLKLKNGYGQIKSLPEIRNNETWNSYLSRINAQYSINGLDGYKEVPDNSVDYCFSFTVFEHIRKNIFMNTIKEMYRFMRPGGICYHTVDFTDHLGGKKNQLRFSESVWEDADHYRMDNYTNRISCSAMREMLEETGFRDVRIKRTAVFGKIPIKRNAISSDLGYMSDDDLKTAAVILVFRK